MLAKWPQGRRIAASAAFSLCVAILVITAFRGMSDMFVVRILQTLAIAVAAVGVIGLVIATVTGRLADYTEPADEEEFEELVRRSERLARDNLAAEPDEDEFLALDPRNPRDFEQLVREALDDLPDLLLKALDHVAVVISDQGRRHRAYGLYHGDGVARDNEPDRIIIFRDTLLRDFGHDPDELREQVTVTVRHELAHHLGADELGVREGVRELGLEGMAGVDRVVPISRPYKLASSELAHHEPTSFSVDGHTVGGGRTFTLIAGPCTVESREQTLGVARAVREGGAAMLRGGAFKPRTSPFAFKGLGEPALQILAEARAATGLPVVTELLDSQHADLLAEHVDVIQIGARNMQNYALLEVAGRLGKPVLLKRGLSSSLDELLMAAD